MRHMNTVKISITVPKPLYLFAEKKAKKLGREREKRPNVSEVFQDLLRLERKATARKNRSRLEFVAAGGSAGAKRSVRA